MLNPDAIVASSFVKETRTMRKLSFMLALLCSVAFVQTLKADEATKEVTLKVSGMT